MVEINLCQLLLATVMLFGCILDTSVFVEAGKKKDKGLIIVLSNGGCGGNILVQTAGKGGKKGGGGHKIVVKGGDSGGGCGCSNSCGSCGGGHEHHTVQHVPIPIPVAAGAPLPPPHEMHAAMMSQLSPVFSADEPHASPSTSDSSSDQDTEPQASDSSPSTSHVSGMKSSSSSSSTSSSDKSDMAAPLFIPANAITPPWFHGSPVFVDPSSSNHLSPSSKTKGYSPSSSSSSSSSGQSNHYEKGEYTSSSDIAPTYNDPMFNLHGTNGQFLSPPPMGFQGFDPNNVHSQFPFQSADGSNKKDQQSVENDNKLQGGRNRNGYLQPLIDSVQRLLRGPGPLRDIEQNLIKQGQRMQASFSNLVPISITNYTSYLPSLPGLRSSSGNRDRKPSGVTPTETTTTNNRGSRYLDSLRIRLRPLAMMEGNRLTSTLENLWKNIRGRTSSSSSSSSSSSNQPSNSKSNINNIPEIGGTNGHLNHQQIHHHQHPLSPSPPNGHHPNFNIPGQQNNQEMQQYLEQVLTSKWWEWPSGGLLGPNLNQY